MTVVNLQARPGVLAQRFLDAAAAGRPPAETQDYTFCFYFEQRSSTPRALEDWREELERKLNLKVRFVAGGAPPGDSDGKFAVYIKLEPEIVTEVQPLLAHKQFVAWCQEKARHNRWKLVGVADKHTTIRFVDGDPAQTSSHAFGTTVPHHPVMAVGDVLQTLHAIARSLDTSERALRISMDYIAALRRTTIVPLIAKLSSGQGLSPQDVEALQNMARDLQIRHADVTGPFSGITRHISLITKGGKDTPQARGPV